MNVSGANGTSGPGAVVWWDGLCGPRRPENAFWDADRTLYSFSPEFTPCFEQSVLVWLSVAPLWLSAPFYLVHLFRRRTVKRYRDKSTLNISKIVLAVLIAMLFLLKLVVICLYGRKQSFALVEYLAPSILLASTILAAWFLHWEFSKGIHSGGVLNVYLLFTVILGVFPFISYITRSIDLGYIENKWEFGFFYATYGLTFILFILEIFADVAALPYAHTAPKTHTNEEKRPLLAEKEETSLEQKNPSPQLTCNFFMNLTFFWIIRLVIKGYKRAITFEDIYNLRPPDCARTLIPTFENYWRKELENKTDCKKHATSSLPILTKDGNDTSTSLFKPLIKTVGWPALIAIFLMATGVLFELLNPILLQAFIGWVGQQGEPRDPFLWKGYLFAVAIAVNNIVLFLLYQMNFFLCVVSGIRMRSCITASVYRKVLKLSSNARKQYTSGEIVNFMSVDADKLQFACFFVGTVFSCPIIIAVAIYLLFVVIGPSTFAGLGMLVLIGPLAGAYVSVRLTQLQKEQMKQKDRRMKVINEILSGIKVLKLYAWEPSFWKKVSDIRNMEISAILKIGYLEACLGITWVCAPYLVSLIIFAVYVLSSPENVLDAQKAFVTLNLINILNWPMTDLPMFITYWAQGLVSLGRIRKLLLAEEIDPENTEHNYAAEDAVTVENGTFTWDETEQPALTNVNLAIEEGQLVAIVGQVGSGKSSLISALLGESKKLSGKINVKGSVAYVSQQAWIQNQTLKSNILFGRPLNQRRYDQIVESCALTPDLKILPGGDLTEIGEKGINLSGGQKQRVNLARAVYQDEAIYLLDDPLSAVDAHVGKHIFDKIIGPSGLLKHKTRILVTHAITYLSRTDKIIVLKDGAISEIGTFNELIANDGAFAEFLRTYLNEEESSEEGEPSQDEMQAKSLIRRQLSQLTSENESGTDGHEGARRRKKSHKKPPALSRSESVKTESQNQNKKLIEEEIAEVGAIKYSVVIAYMKAGGVTLCVLAFVITVLYIAANSYTNIWLSDWSNDPPPVGQAGSDKLNLRLGIYGGMGVIQAILVLSMSLMIFVGASRASKNLHARLLDRILHAPMSFFDTTPLGRIMNRFSKDMDTVDTNMPMWTRTWFFMLSPVITTIFLISYTTPIILIPVVPVAIIYYFIQRIYISGVRQLKRIDSIRRSPLYVHFDESLSGLGLIRAYRRQRDFIAKVDVLTDESQMAYYSIQGAQRWLGNALNMLASFLIMLASVFVVLQRDSLTAGMAGLSVTYALQSTFNFNFLIRSSTELETYVVSVERIKEYSEVDEEASWEVEERRPPENWPHEGRVEFVDYSTRYRPGLPLVLNGISCCLQPGQKVGIVGRTGAGKSSMTLALFRMIEAAGGRILIDGVDISSIGLHDLRGRLTIIPQDPVLFAGTLRLNLDPLSVHSDEEIWTTLGQAHLKQYVLTLSTGLEYEVGEGGQALSVGQRQLVCLARALLRRSKVLILDEATAAVDLETDDLIQTTVKHEFSECTVITIAHRLNTIMDYDRVIVLDNGSILEFDSPPNLLKDKTTVFAGMAHDAGLL